MLPADIEEITSDHIVALITEKVSERRVLEYKESLPGGSDLEKKEFLADVCSFANASGGDIIYGISDERGTDGRATGLPESIMGLPDESLPADCARLEAIIREGIKPRVPRIQTKTVRVEGYGAVILIRIGRSWAKPHMVTYKGTSRFYSRHSSGKYQLDVQEIGQAFAEQRGLGEELRSWRTGRLSLQLSDEGPVRLRGPARLLVYFVSVAALAERRIVGSWPLPESIKSTLKTSSGDNGAMRRYNADGFLRYCQPDDRGMCASYVQLFRYGCLEYADGEILNAGRYYGAGREAEIPSQSFEELLVDIYDNALLAINAVPVEDPVYFSCALTGVQGLRLSQSGNAFVDHGARHTFDRHVIQTPEALVDRSETRPYRTSLLPIVNSIWQANGYEQTPLIRNWQK